MARHRLIMLVLFVLVDYLISCKKCGIQYIGETSQKLRNRMNNHRNRLYLYQHASNPCISCTLSLRLTHGSLCQYCVHNNSSGGGSAGSGKEEAQ